MGTSFRDALFAQLTAALRARGICTVSRDSEAPPAAVVTFSDEGQGRVTIVVKDALLAKRVERSVELSSIPPDGRPLALALAADELLRASWAELLLVDARPHAHVPAEVRHAVVPNSRVELGLNFATEHYTQGNSQLGGDMSATFWALPRVGLTARAGYRWVPTVEAPHGEVRATATVASLGPIVEIARAGDRIGVDVGARLALVRIQFATTGDTSVRTHDATKTALYVNAGPRGWFTVGRGFRVVADLGAGAPLHSLEGLDGARRLTGVAGMQLSMTLGVVGVF